MVSVDLDFFSKYTEVLLLSIHGGFFPEFLTSELKSNLFQCLVCSLHNTLMGALRRKRKVFLLARSSELQTGILSSHS